MIFKDRGIEIKTREQILSMRAAGLVVGRTLELLRGEVRAGISTGELDAIAEDNIRSSGATPSFKGYHGFTGSICASVNDEIVHGIPGDRVLADGDLISIDCGAIVDGWHGDAAITVAVGEVAAGAARAGPDLRGVDVARVRRGEARRPADRHLGRGRGPRPGQLVVRDRRGLRRARDRFGDAPAAERAELRPAGRGPKLVEGLALAVEPMLTLGKQDNHTLEDDWTVVTNDGKAAAHTEHTFTLTPQGPWVLTALDGGEAKLAELGVKYGALAD